MSALLELAARWKLEAELLRSYAADGAAAAADRHAAELEAALQATDSEVLTLPQAVEHSGLSERRLRELAAAGKLENIGRRGAPRFRRGDLPRKAAKPAAVRAYDPREDAARLLAGRS